jgi:outer membrane protein assembly factor BamB
VALRPDGTERWTVDLDVAGVESPTLADGVLYVPTGDATVALDTADGTELWRSDRAIGTAQTVAADTLYGTREDRIVALDRETGDQRWSLSVYPRRYADSMIRSVRTTPVAIGDQLLVAAASGELFSIR